MTSVARRVVDRQILHLLKMWLEAPVDETDDQGRTRRTTRSRDSKRGIPQGAPISPLLSNLYMRRLVLGWKRLGFERRFGAPIVSYARRSGDLLSLSGSRSLGGTAAGGHSDRFDGERG